MRYLTFLLILLTVPMAYARPTEVEQSVAAVLNDFHDAASKADGKRYFGHFTENGIFLGTDIKERWTVAEFQDYARPHFEKGRGWTYTAKSRNIYLSPDGKTAWFDEILLNEKFGETRGSGVLSKTENGWKVAQYHLTLPVPNELIEGLVKQIKDGAQ